MNEFRIRPVGFEAIPLVATLNRQLFDEERIINRFDRPDLVMMMAFFGDEPAGFKIGYGLNQGVYYSAKGGVLERYRRRGIASGLLDGLMEEAMHRGYRTYCFDTFPNRHVGMAVLAIERGFTVSEVRFSDIYHDLRVRFQSSLGEFTS